MMRRSRPREPERPPAGRTITEADELSALLTASQVVNSALELSEALQVVLSTAKKLLGGHEGSVMLLEADGYLRIFASEGIPQEAVDSLALRPGEGVAGRVVQTGRALLLNVTPDRRSFESFVDPHRPLVSAVSVPLKIDRRMVGVLNLNLTSGSRQFTEGDLRRAEIFAEHAAMVLYKARRRAEDAELLSAASQDLGGLLDVELLLERFLTGALRILDARAGVVCVAEARAGQMGAGVFRGIPRGDVQRLVASPELSALLKHNAAVVEPVAGQPGLALLRGIGEVATVHAGRLEGNRRLVLIAVGDQSEQARVRLCESFAAQVAAAVRNAELHRRVVHQQSQLSAIVHSIPTPVVVVDQAHRLVVANPAAEELFGFSLDFVEGRGVHELGDDALESLLAGEGYREVEVALGDAGRTWKARISPMRDAGPLGGGQVLVLEDIASAKETERMKADFVAVAGHELRTPLTLVKGYIKTLLLRRDRMDHGQVTEALMTAEAQAHRLERLIEDLLSISGLEGSRPSLHLEQVDLVATIAKLVEELKRSERDRPFTIEGPAMVPVRIDATKVEQILYHLLANACKYSEQTTPVSVVATDRPSEVEVAVIDRGIGILSSNLPHLFDRFYQVDNSSTRAHGGTGIGLYIAKRLVEAHGGHIRAESIWGKGSTFRFTIPKTPVLI